MYEEPLVLLKLTKVVEGCNLLYFKKILGAGYTETSQFVKNESVNKSLR